MRVLESLPRAQREVPIAYKRIRTTAIAVLGFPTYHDGDSVSFRRGHITQSRAYLKVPHFLVDADVVVGNSGGPVLNEQSQVVGIAVKGMQIPGIFSQFDQLSSFVPISLTSQMTTGE